MQLGRTKVFLRAGQIGLLDSRRNEVLNNAARLIQGRFLTYNARKDFTRTRRAAITLQSYCRGTLQFVVEYFKSMLLCNICSVKLTRRLVSDDDDADIMICPVFLFPCM